MITDKIKIQAEKAVENYLKQFEGQKIKDEVYRILEAHIETIVGQVIGFRKDSWSHEWIISHHSNQPGIREVAQQAERHARVLVLELMDSYEFKLSDNEMKQLQSHYRARLKEAIKDELTNMAKQKAHEFLDQIIEKAITEESC